MNFDLSTSRCSVDWFRGSLRKGLLSLSFSFEDFCCELYSIDSRFDFSNFILQPTGIYNYKYRYVHKDCPSLMFAFNLPNDLVCDLSDNFNFASYVIDFNCRNPGLFFNFSGEACRFIGDDSLKFFFKHFERHYDVCVTRLDLALDFFDPDNSIVPFLQNGFSNFLYPKVGDISISSGLYRVPGNIKSYVNFYPDGKQTTNFSLGNHGSSRGMIRLYDKFHQFTYSNPFYVVDSDGKSVIDYPEQMYSSYWYRLELECHRCGDVYFANEVFHYLVQSDFNIFSSFGQGISGFLSFSLVSYVYDSRVEFSSSTEWLEFLDILSQNIDFVKLVVDKFHVRRSVDYYWGLLSHFSCLVSAFEQLKILDYKRFNSLMLSARQRRVTDPKLCLDYSQMNVFKF